MTAKTNWRETFEELDALSRERALTMHESLRLEKAMRMMDREEPVPPNSAWRDWEDRSLRTLFARGTNVGDIAKRLGRPREAVGRRLRQLSMRRGK
jgi:hypothetical protein